MHKRRARSVIPSSFSRHLCSARRRSARVAAERIEASDVLAYTTAQAEWEGDLPPDAVLVSPVAPLGRTDLGAVSLAGGDRVVLYSLGQKRVLRTISADDLAQGGD